MKFYAEHWRHWDETWRWLFNLSTKNSILLTFSESIPPFDFHNSIFTSLAMLHERIINVINIYQFKNLYAKTSYIIIPAESSRFSNKWRISSLSLRIIIIMFETYICQRCNATQRLFVVAFVAGGGGCRGRTMDGGKVLDNFIPS